MDTIKNRYDFVFYFDVKDGNPNGDPDAGNLPRIDPETGHGIVTDVCLKRKVRNYVLMTHKSEKPNDIFIKEKAVLNLLIQEAHNEVEKDKSVDKNNSDKTEAARQWMCKNYYDVRTFGAVLTTGENAGQVRGPVQLTFGRSVEPIVALEHTITRVAKTTEERSEAGGSEMGRKYTIPYGLYRSYGFVSPFLAAQTGFCEDDLNIFWKAMCEMFEHDRSAARGLMSSRRLIVFEHKTALGSKPAHELFNRVTHRKTTDGPAREFSDYQILLDGSPVDEIFKIVKVE
jgi:CRISPR-associated protein Csd2